MANNIIGGQANVAIAKQNILVSATGITAVNTNIVYLMEATIKSYVPGRVINGFNMLVFGKGYLINAKIDMDLSEFFVPPFEPDWIETEW